MHIAEVFVPPARYVAKLSDLTSAPYLAFSDAVLARKARCRYLPVSQYQVKIRNDFPRAKNIILQGNPVIEHTLNVKICFFYLLKRLNKISG